MVVPSVRAWGFSRKIVYFLIQYEKGTPMKKNLKILLFIAVCAIAGKGLLYVKEYSQRQQINSETDEM